MSLNDNLSRRQQASNSRHSSLPAPDGNLNNNIGSGYDSNNGRNYIGGFSTSVSLGILIAIFSVSAILLFVVYQSFPEFQQNELEYVKLPRSMEDAKHLGQVLSRYKDDYYLNVLSAVFITYIFLQTFAIPGSIFLSVMSGFLFPFHIALFLVCFCSATGASLCYLLSQMVGRRLVFTYFPDKAEEWRQAVDRHREDLLNYMIFLRITPFLPNWFINITAPVVGVSLSPFWLGTFVGVAPPSFVAIRTGTTLHEMASSSASLSWTSVLILVVLGCVSLVPILVKYKLKNKFQ